MVRGLALFTSAVVAMSAGAREAQVASQVPASEETVRPAPVAGTADGDQPPVMVASTGTPRGQPSLLSPSRPGAKADGGVQGAATPQDDAMAALDDFCAIELMLADADLVDRRYDPGPAHMTASWAQVPAVTRATRCGHRYLIQVKSVSDAPWFLREARLEGPNGEVLKVYGILHRALGGWFVNGIIAEVPEGAGADFSLSRLVLTGQDGRVAQPDGVLLP